MSRDFFQTGGTLGEDAPSYIERPADRKLATALAKNEVCLVLAPRQTGKSSLMVHALAGLRRKGTRPAVVDLQLLGEHREFARWLSDVVYQIENTLGLDTDVTAWWQTHEQLGATQRFMRFVEEVVLTETGDSPVVVFFDEIDSVLPLPFADDFFTTLRALYNARAVKPSLKRLSFVLLGVAGTTDFIRDSRRPPFNVGTGIPLQDFDPAATGSFRAVLGDKSADLIERIFYWSGGQPFMVQSLAEAVWKLPAEKRSVAAVDDIVQQTFLKGKIEQNTHFKFIQSYLLGYPKLRRLLGLYRRVLRGKRVAADEQDPLQNRLRLAGVVRVEEGRLRPRNRIYSRIFDPDWIKQHFPSDRQRLALYGMAVLMVAWLGWQFLVQPLLFPRFPPLTSIVRYTAEPVVEIPIDLNGTNVSQVRLGDEILFAAKGLPVLFQQENLRHRLASLPVGRQNLKLQLTGGWPHETREIPLTLVHYPGWEIKQIPDKRLETLNPILDIEEKKIVFRDVMNGRVLGELTAFEQPITAVRLSTDRRRLLVGTQAGQISLWEITLVDPGDVWRRDVNTKRLQKFSGHSGAILALAFSIEPESKGRSERSHGSTILSAGRDRIPRLWDVESGDELRRFEGHEDAVSALLVADARSFFSASEDGTVRRWDMLTGKQIDRVELPGFEAVRHQEAGQATECPASPLVTTLALSPNGKRLLAAGAQGISLWDLGTDEPPRRFAMAGRECDPDRRECHPERSEGSCESLFTGYPHGNQAAFTPNGQGIVSGGPDGTLTLYDLADGQAVRSYSGLDTAIRSLEFGALGQLLLAQGVDNSLKVWERTSGEEIPVYVGHSDAILGVDFSPAGHLIATSGRSLDSTLRIWEADSGRLRSVCKHPENTSVWGPTFTPDSRQVITSEATLGKEKDILIRFCDVATGKTVRSWPAHDDYVWDLDLSPDGKLLALASADNSVKLWDVAGGEELAILEGHTKWANGVAFSPDGKLLASASSDGSLRLWEIPSGRALGTLFKGEDWIPAVDFSPDGKRIVAAVDDRTLKLFDVATGQLLRTFEGHEDRFTPGSVAFSPDGKRVASANRDDTVKLWDAANGKMLRNYTGHKADARAVVFFPDGKRLVSVGHDGTLKIWWAAVE